MTMNPALKNYFEKRRLFELSQPQVRDTCHTCLQPETVCYCDLIKPFDPKIEFAILIHPIERKRRVATGRMSHLMLKRSHLITGHDYSNDPKVNALIENPKNNCLILYPGQRSHNIGEIEGLNESARTQFFPDDKNLVLFVIDGTWNTARKTMYWSQNLLKLPRICFTPKKPSNFRVRKQPSPEYYSTIEAIHETIELLGPIQHFDVASRAHDQLLRAFNWMVDKQISSYTTPNPRKLKKR
jgi:DTW domain-containing protein YfiP